MSNLTTFYQDTQNYNYISSTGKLRIYELKHNLYQQINNIEINLRDYLQNYFSTFFSKVISCNAIECIRLLSSLPYKQHTN